MIEAFKCLGWDLILNDEENSVQFVSRENAQVNEDAMILLMVASKVKKAEGKEKMTEQLERFAKMAYVAWNGTEVGCAV